jgi:hypothetical protein
MVGQAGVDDIQVKSYWYPDRSADLKEVKVGYSVWKRKDRLVVLLLIPIIVSALSILYNIQSTQLAEIYQSLRDQIHLQSNEKEFWVAFSALLTGLAALIILSTVYFMKRATPVYLINFCTYQAPEELKVPHKTFMEKSEDTGKSLVIFVFPFFTNICRILR